MSYIPAKQLILLQSLQQIALFSLLKLQGVSIDSYPELLDDLITTRLVMEKFRPLDTKLQYQLERLTRMAQSSEVQESTQYGPRPDLLEKSLTTEAQFAKLENEEKPEVYKPSKTNPVYFKSKGSEKTKKELERKKEKLRRSAYIKEMQRDSLGAPIEISMRPQLDSKIEAEEKRIEKFEESTMKRVVRTKEQKKRKRAAAREARLGEVRNNADFKIVDDIFKIQDDMANQQRERQEQNLKFNKLVKSYKTKKRKHSANDGKKKHKSA